MDWAQTLIRLIDQGLTARVMLPDGSLIGGFSPHDLIARGPREAGILVLRGVIGGTDDPPEDRVIPLCDIRGAFSDRPLRPAQADPEFLRRNPVPRGWTVIRSLTISPPA